MARGLPTSTQGGISMSHPSTSGSSAWDLLRAKWSGFYYKHSPGTPPTPTKSEILSCHHLSLRGSWEPPFCLYRVGRFSEREGKAAVKCCRWAGDTLISTGVMRFLLQVEEHSWHTSPRACPQLRGSTCGITLVDLARNSPCSFPQRCVASEKRNPSVCWGLQLRM